MTAIVGSEDLIDEPEFEDIFPDPMLCVETLAEAAEESDIAPESLSQMSEEELFGTRLDLLEMTTEQLLTDELRQDIIHGLNTLRLRLKRSGERDKVAQVAALQSFLSFDESRELWATIGLVQAIVQRSLATGFELLDASVEVMGADHLGEEDAPSTLMERFAKSSLADKWEPSAHRMQPSRQHIVGRYHAAPLPMGGRPGTTPILMFKGPTMC